MHLGAVYWYSNAIAEYVELCGYKHGEMGRGREKIGQNDLSKLSQDNIAKTLGISVKSLKRAISIERNLTEDMKELLDTGVISKTLASDIIAGLTPEEQTDLISNLDVTKKITQKEVQEHINENRRLKQELENKPTESAKDIENEILRNENSNLKSEYQRVTDENNMLKTNIEASNIYKEYAKEYVDVRQKVDELDKTPGGKYDQFQANIEISKLNEELKILLKEKLSPIQYSGFMFIIRDNKNVRENFLNTLSLVKNWYNEMISALEQEDINCNIIDKNDMNIIDMEE